MQASSDGSRPTILVTGISGNLGRRLLPLLPEFRIVGVDLSQLGEQPSVEFHSLHLGRESSCVELVRLMRATGVEMVVHLAFVVDPLRTGIASRDLMWQANVAGTARVMEAITEVNRHAGHIRKFLFPSGAFVYGAETEPNAAEDAKHAPQTLPYALDQAEADHVVRFRAASMAHCATYLLRPQVFAGASVEHSMIDALRGRAYGPRGTRWQAKDRRIPLVLPMGREVLEKQRQFVHVDDVARLLRWLLLRKTDPLDEPTVLNVAAPGEPLSLAHCTEIAQSRLWRIPSRKLCVRVMESFWKRGLSAVPPEAFPYLCGSNTVSTNRLRALLGADFSSVMRYSNEAAFADSFRDTGAETASPEAVSEAEATPSR